MVSPLALVVDVHSLFALAGGFHHRAVGVNDRLHEELFGCAADLQADHIEEFLQTADWGFS